MSFEAVVRSATPGVLAALARRGAHLDEAEDALQEALLAATQQWPSDGTPRDPAAWLVTVAGRRLVDRWRASGARTDRERLVAGLDVAGPVTAVDDSATLLLLCCHPALPRAAQVALTLRAVGGLSTAQIARGFLVPETTMAQRLSRARARLREVDARFGDVAAADLPARVDAALHVLYLVFTEGHTASAGEQLLDVALADEAIRLTRLLHDRLPDETEVAGLLALMLLTDARRAARTAPDGSLVPLAEQDRDRWDRAAVAEGVALLEAALPVGPVGPFQLQAAIAAVHDEAVDAQSTDWVQIETLYRMLADVAPGPMVELNRAVAVAMVDGPRAGLALVDALADDRRLARHHRLHAVRAHLLERAGRPDEAAAAYRRAARLTTSVPEQRYLNERARTAELS
ncbi:RNA polymerase sigma factor [Jatrophihabitans endophyticus]|uniref:RNA polymerase sigma factor n=1 Tax=Jatrophihabitans endophyticus TaxID=1206085 RepID=UPI0019E73846|nr:DUF6596 domain-containing protein [Jatrophihabitans endophyticus]MBE7189764.1 RNA polymerase sigma factor [Jatrophihabitans endophyticus]